MLLLTNNVGDPQKLIDMKFSIYSYIKMKYFALKIEIHICSNKHETGLVYGREVVPLVNMASLTMHVRMSFY